MYLVKTPQLVQKLFPKFTWRIPTTEKVIYLTFDDGPIPEITPWVMQQLNLHDAKATFFCVGENVVRYPNIFQALLAEGHQVGNHTQQHLDAWKTSTSRYLNNVAQCAKSVASPLFRPPYGHLTPSQAKALQKQYRIILWDVLSGDFDPSISKEQCWQNIQQHTTAGSIVVLHDSWKAAEKLRYVLPKTLAFFSKQGYIFRALS
ncbi:MAG: polysaccharide deacetylase family protein [Bacteroidota bacterium]